MKLPKHTTDGKERSPQAEAKASELADKVGEKVLLTKGKTENKEKGETNGRNEES